MEAARNLKVNLKLEGKPCRSCQVPLKLAEDAAVCAGCEAEHHSRCWDSNAGCATPGCVNAPLKRLDAPVPGMPQGMPQGRPMAPALAAGMMNCPNCRNVITMGSFLCPFCNAITSPDGIYHGPQTNAPGAVASLVCGIIGLLLCGVILGPIAIVQSNKAKKAIASNPTYTGGGLATAGMVLGVLDLVAFLILLMVKLGNTH